MQAALEIIAIVNSGFREDVSGTRELSPASVYISLLSVVEACVVIGERGHVGEYGLLPTRRRPSILIRVLAQGLDAPAAVKAVHRVLK